MRAEDMLLRCAQNLSFYDRLTFFEVHSDYHLTPRWLSGTVSDLNSLKYPSLKNEICGHGERITPRRKFVHAGFSVCLTRILRNCSSVISVASGSPGLTPAASFIISWSVSTGVSSPISSVILMRLSKLRKAFSSSSSWNARCSKS
eukprot:01465_1